MDRRIVEKARRIDTAAGHRFAHPDFIERAAELDAPALTEWARVLAYQEHTGLPNVLHVIDTERPDQYRGVSYLAQVSA